MEYLSHDEYIKVFLSYFNERTQLQDLESLWAVDLGDNSARIDNIPFLAENYALNDIVRYEIHDGMNVVTDLVEASGNSCLQIVVFDVALKEPLRERLRGMGCESEGSHLPQLISVDIPAHVDYNKVRQTLEDEAAKGLLDFKEACIGHS